MNFKLTKSSLNFKVYTSPTIPSSGTENDIVIISSTPMENWILSSDAPVGEPRNNGDIWIKYSVSGNVFDVMNQHDFMLAITKIYQYVNRTWVSVNARRYVGGVWNVVSTAFSATINITYPANSNCVVTNSSGQTVANDTNTGTSSKTWTATVNAKGAYTVTATATDGSGKSKSQDVSIASDGQSVSVELAYELVLFDGADGGDNTAVTGGWDADGHGGPTIALGSNIGLDASFSGQSGYKSWMFATNNLVDVKGYSKLHAIVKTMSGITTAQLCVTNEINTNNGEYLGANDPVAAADASVGECVLDISSLNGSYHLGLWCESNILSYSTYHITLLASKIWLE